MSLIKLGQNLFETSTIVLRPERTYVSGADGKVLTGSLTIAARPSKRIKQLSNSIIEQFEDKIANTFLAGHNTFLAVRDADKDSLGATVIADADPLSNQPNIFAEISQLNRLDTNLKTNFISGTFYDYSSKLDRVVTDTYPNHDGGRFFAAADLTIVNNVASFAVNSLSTIQFEHPVEVSSRVTDEQKARFQFTAITGSINDKGNTDIQRKTALKKYVINQLIPHYKSNYNNCDFSYSNYHCLNFYTTPEHNQKEVLVYEIENNALSDRTAGEKKEVTEFYTSFWINPRYTSDTPGGDFTTGTVMHISSSLAISLVTGSSRDIAGYPDKFRIMLQLGHSADINPSKIPVTGSSNRVNNSKHSHDLIYLTDDNTLDRNSWHFVSAKWSADQNNKFMSLRVDDKVLKANIPSSSIADNNSTGQDKVFIGNYFDAVATQVDNFFDSTVTNEFDGTTADHFVTNKGNKSDVAFNDVYSAPLNAEIHEIRAHSTYLDDTTEDKYRYTSIPEELHEKYGLNFYVPVVYDSKIRNNAPAGSQLLSIANRDTGVTYGHSVTSPFNLFLSNGTGGKYINLHTFTRNFGKGYITGRGYQPEGYARPIAHTMTASILQSGETKLTDSLTFLYRQPGVRKRNTLIMPCDNGLFAPDYNFNTVSTSDRHDFTMTTFRNANDLGNQSIETINLKNIVSQSDDSSFHNLNARHFNLFLREMTQDVSSNDICIFAISNLYFGERIHPGSFTMLDNAVTGSGNKISMTIRDDGRGSLYRSDANTTVSIWNSIGNIFYDEGIVLIKSPHPPFFGKAGYTMRFKGEQSVHVTSINVPCPEDMFISSSNSTYQVLTASNINEEKNNPFVYISGINIHDDNLNVIMKGTLAQPVKKRNSDSFLFRVKQDY